MLQGIEIKAQTMITKKKSNIEWLKNRIKEQKLTTFRTYNSLGYKNKLYTTMDIFTEFQKINIIKKRLKAIKAGQI